MDSGVGMGSVGTDGQWDGVCGDGQRDGDGVCGDRQGDEFGVFMGTGIGMRRGLFGDGQWDKIGVFLGRTMGRGLWGWAVGQDRGHRGDRWMSLGSSRGQTVGPRDVPKLTAPRGRLSPLPTSAGSCWAVLWVPPLGDGAVGLPPSRG